MVVLNNFSPDIRVYKEAKSLVSAGHQVEVLALKTPTSAEREEMAGFTVRRIQVRTRSWPKWLPLQALKYLEFVTNVLLEVQRCRPEVVHAHDFNALPSAWLAARLVRAKTVYDTHEFWLGTDYPFFGSRFGKWFVRQVEGYLIRRVDAVITINRAISDQLASLYGIPQPTVVMNAQPLTNPRPSDKLRSVLRVDSNTRIVIYAASFRTGRGLEKLIESTQYFDNNNLLVLMGPDRMGGRLQSYANEPALQSRVRFLPPVPEAEVAEYVASADVGVVPSQSTSLNRYYGLGNKIFHYIAAGVPVVVSNQPERRRIVEQYDIGAVFDETDPQDIARTIRQLVDDPRAYQQLRQRVREAHWQALNWEHEVQKLSQVYQTLSA
jgi:glycosyltransferase involved in cell wall biosynthesis